MLILESVKQCDLNGYFSIREEMGLVDKYNKVGTCEARLVTKPEKVKTVINGEKETENFAQKGDVVIKNPDGEIYPISRTKFNSRYSGKITDEFSTVKCTGSCYATEWVLDDVKIVNEAGNDMILTKGDMLAKTNLKSKDQYYRIEKGAFGKTYKKGK